jgi:hypothetical protein
MKRAILQFYRECIRTCETFPVEHLRRKLSYNIRDLFDMHRYETDLHRIQDYIVHGRQQLNMLHTISRWDKTLLQRLFKVS